MNIDSLKYHLKIRRENLAKLYSYPLVLWSGNSLSRNFHANHYYFRANSHFLYFAGISLPEAAIYLDQGKLTLFYNEPDPDSTMWYGEIQPREEIAENIGADSAYPLSELGKFCQSVATIPVLSAKTYQQQCQLLQRPLAESHQLTGIDQKLAEAIVALRLNQDQMALSEIKKAVAVSVKAHRQGMMGVTKAKTEAEVRALIEGQIMAENMSCAYNSIVTVNGEVLHNDKYNNSLDDGDLLLADVGAETQGGWAADLTRTYPVNGKFSSTQQDIYQLVLAAHDSCIAQIRPGIEYRDIHLHGCEILADGLVELGILRGKPEDLVAQDAHALFFPHGMGHLLGLDVHDLEDLGDLAGYESGRKRSDRFGLKYLRLDRLLSPNMVVTIEPGFYQIPAIVNNGQFRDKYQEVVNWDKLAQFSDVKGIRIEDDILVTENGAEILSVELPTQIKEIEEILNIKQNKICLN